MACSPNVSPDSRAAQRGFSTVEVLVGMSILIVAVVLVGGHFRTNQKAARKSDAFFITTQMASARLERARRQLSDPDTLKSLLALIGTGEYSRTRKETLQGKDYVVTIRYRRLSPAGNLMKVRATVAWDKDKRNTLGTVFPFAP